MRPRFVCHRSLPRACSPCAKYFLIGAVGAQGLLAEGGAGRSPSTTTAAAVLLAILQLIGAVGFASRHPANTVFDANVQHDVRQRFVEFFWKSDG